MPQTIRGFDQKASIRKTNDFIATYSAPAYVYALREPNLHLKIRPATTKYSIPSPFLPHKVVTSVTHIIANKKLD